MTTYLKIDDGLKRSLGYLPDDDALDSSDEERMEATLKGAENYVQGAIGEDADDSFYKDDSVFELYKLAINKIIFYKDFAYLVLDEEDFSSTNTNKEDTDDILAFLQGLEDYDLIAIIKEVKDIYKVSLRSKYKYDVGTIGEDFNGGGHKYAAGFSYKHDIDELISKLKGYVDNAN